MIGNKLNLDIKRLMLKFFAGILFGILTIVVLILLVNVQPDLMYFWAGAIVSIWIWIVSISISKKSNKKIDEILDTVKRIEARLDKENR